MNLSIDVDGPLLQMVTSYRRFGKTYLFHLRGSRIQNTFGFLNPEDGTDSRKPEVTLVTSVRPINFCGLDFPLRPTDRGGFIENNVRVFCDPISTVLRIHLRSQRPPSSETRHRY